MQRRILSRRLLPPPSLTPKARSPAPVPLPTRNRQVVSQARPQLPFLSTPLSRNHQFRYLTTARKQWIIREVVQGFKFAVYFWAIGGCCLVIYYILQQEWLEKKYPTPHEWGIITRLRFRIAKWGPDRTDWIETDWVVIGEYVKNVLERLEDAAIEGAGLSKATDNGIWTDGVGNVAYDITAKSEPWRRGYYEALMLAARAAEQLDDHVVDTTRHLVFPASTIIGPSNPNPRPIPFGSEKAPLEENCERAYEEPEIFYRRLLTTRGFSPKQMMDAALAYASWLEFRGKPDLAGKLYEWALSFASHNMPETARPYNRHSYILRDDAGPPSSNILTSLTALAAHKARSQDVSAALPILLSVLRARRSLSEPRRRRSAFSDDSPEHDSPWTMSNMFNVIKRLVAAPEFPPPPPDGDSPPERDAKERCEEAALSLYIGEIIYASKAREDGLAWTREAVDIAEEQLHDLEPADTSAKQTCKECLTSGLENWAKMIARLAREEREREASNAPTTSAWFGLWGDPKQDVPGRWTAEENVVKERTRRAKEIIEELEAPSTTLASLFQV